MADQVDRPKKLDQSRPDFSLELAAINDRPDLFSHHNRIVIGVDEAGRGPWAGPVTAGAAWITPDQWQDLPSGLNDSKKLNAARRRDLFLALQDNPQVKTATASSSVEVIDQDGILNATFKAMDDAVMVLLQQHDPDVDVTVLVDGNLAPPFPQLRQVLQNPPVIIPVIKGDGRSLSIAAASITAKETRDQLMDDLDQQCPGYGWADNKGYGTKSHQAGLAKQGVTPHHRRSFKPIERLLAATPTTR